MASRISPYVDNTGLVFAYDLANVNRSYLGEPTANLIDSVNFTTDYNTSWNAQENIIQTKNQINPLGDIDVTAIKIESNSNSDNYFGVRGIKFASSGTNHTFSFWAKGNKAYNNFPINFGAYQVQVTVNITTEWKYFTVQTGAGTTFIDHTLHFGGWGTWTDNTFDLFLWRPQLELKSHATPYVNGTRSVTQGLKDLTGKSTIDLTNVSFDANAQMTFDGTNDSLVVGNNAVLKNNNSSIEFLIKYLNTPNGDIIQFGVGSGTYAQYYYRAYSGYSYWNWYPVGTGYGEIAIPNAALPLNKYHHIVMTGDDQGYVQFYINGTLQTGATRTANSQPANWTPADLTVGGFSWDGYSNSEISYLKIYNRVLPASEIQQNFNAIKGRYGL
jgi:hypothetical protein